MAEEVVVAEQELQSNDEAADLESGFAGEPTVEAPPAGEPAPVEVVPEVKYRQVTEDEWSASQATSTQIRADVTAGLDKAFGKVGGIERTLKELQQATPRGGKLVVNDDIVAELAAEFPEIGGLVLSSFKKLASQIEGSAGPAGVDPAQLEENVSARVTDRVRALQVEALEEDHPTWREIVGPKGADTPYRNWLATQPAEYQERLSSTDSAVVIGKSLTKFEASAKASAALAAEKPSARQKRLEASVVTKGIGGVAPGPTDEDEFNAGFKSG